MPFIINEEAALKTLLSGMTVADSGNATRPVGVFYGQPDKEIRQQSYPYITIDLVAISEEVNRAHRGVLNVPRDTFYTPEGVTDTNLNVNYPIPVSLTYQVSTWSRQPRHDRQIIAQLFSYGRLPFRFGQLPIPEDGTNRRLDVLGVSKRDTTENEKRLFSNVYTIRISAEIFQDVLIQMYQVTENPTITFNYQDVSFTSNV
jgi:hypothetical protein